MGGESVWTLKRIKAMHFYLWNEALDVVLRSLIGN